MDAVILAAGRGSRLDGIAAPFHKPLLVINGKSIIGQTVDQVSLLQMIDRVVVVVAPENASPISHVLGPARVDMIVQRRPNGPGGALLEGLKLLEHRDEVLVLMGDNVSTFADIQRVAATSGFVVGVQAMSLDEVGRFTRLRRYPGRDEWVEKVPVTEADAVEQGMAIAWVGPFKVPSADDLRDALMKHPQDGATLELPIGPVFNTIAQYTDGVQTVAVTTIDIGVPEALV